MFSFTSFGISLDEDLAFLRQCIYTFRAYGQIYHDLPALVLEENNPCYFQLYFYDTDNELQNRMRTQYNENLSAKVVEKLMKILKQNPYAQVLRRLEDKSSFEDFEIHIVANSNLDQRVYNRSSVDQVAAIWVEGNNPNIPFKIDIIVHAHLGTRHRLKYHFGCYDP